MHHKNDLNTLITLNIFFHDSYTILYLILFIYYSTKVNIIMYFDLGLKIQAYFMGLEQRIFFSIVEGNIFLK